MIETLLDIGPVGIPILLASVLGVTVFIERLFSLRTDKLIPKNFVNMIEKTSSKQEVEALFDVLSSDSILGEMLTLIAVQHKKEQTRSQITARLEEWAAQKAATLEKGLGIISVVASISPLLGLLGTVLGMVLTFDAIKTYGLGNIDGLAGGISQALLTTLLGLSVGIPALIAHRYLEHKVDSILLELERIATIILDNLNQRQSREKQ